MKSTILSVTQLNTYIKSIIDGDMLLRSLYVVGEISNFSRRTALPSVQPFSFMETFSSPC